MLLPTLLNVALISQTLAGSASRLSKNVDFGTASVAFWALEPNSLTSEVHRGVRQSDAFIHLVPFILKEAEAVF